MIMKLYVIIFICTQYENFVFCSSHPQSMDSKLTNQSLNYSTLQTLILSSNRKVQILEERTLKLECIILNHPKDQSPGGILWQLNGSPLDFRWHRGGLHLKIIRNTRSTEASLTLIRTRTTDSGTYSCHSIQAQNSTLKVTFDELKVEILPLSKDYSYSSSSSSYCFKCIYHSILLCNIFYTILLLFCIQFKSNP